MSDPRKVTITLAIHDYADLIGHLRIAGAEAAQIAEAHGDEPVIAAAARVRGQRLVSLAETLIHAAADRTASLPAVSSADHFVGRAA